MANDTAVDLTDIGFVPVAKPAAAVKSVDLSDIGFVPVKKVEASGPQELFPAEGEAGKPSKGERDPRTGLPQAPRDFAAGLRKTKGTALQGGLSVAGGLIGTAGGPFAPLTVPLGSALGGALGNILNQETNPEYDTTQPGHGVKKGEVVGAAISSGIPGSSLASSGMGGVLKEGIKQGLGGLAAKTAETAIDEGRLPTGKEALASSVIPALAGAGIEKLAQSNPAIQKALADAEAAKPVKQKTYEAGAELGLKAASKEGRPPAVISNILSAKNQPKINEAASIDLGLPKKTEITPEVLNGIRKEEAVPYSEIESLASAAKEKADQIRKERFTATDPHELAVRMNDPKTVAELAPLDIQAAANVDGLKEARKAASKGFSINRNTPGGNPQALEAAQNALEQSKKLEDQIDQAAQSAGKPDLVDRLAASRKRIAKTYDYEGALNSSNADISAPDLGRMLDNKRPLSGNAKAIADFNNAFPYATKEAAKTMSPGLTRTEGMTTLLSALGGTGAGAIAGHPGLGALAGLTPLLGPAKRRIITSDAYQKIFPRYAPTRIEDLKSMALQEAAQAAGQQK